MPPGLDRTVRFLRLLTGLLAGTMIVGLIAIVGLLVTRLPEMVSGPALPGGVRLPDGVTAEAITLGPGWALVVTRDGEAVAFDPATGTVTNRMRLAP
ncbi:MAG: DUF6476 family protein [Paracoccaceae bacterium]